MIQKMSYHPIVLYFRTSEKAATSGLEVKKAKKSVALNSTVRQPNREERIEIILQQSLGGEMYLPEGSPSKTGERE